MPDDGIWVFLGDILDVHAALTAADDARSVGLSRLQDGEVVFSPQVQSLGDGDLVHWSTLLARLFGEERVADHPRRDLRALVRRIHDSNASLETRGEGTLAATAGQNLVESGERI